MPEPQQNIEWNGEPRAVERQRGIIVESADGSVLIQDTAGSHEVFSNNGKLSDGLFFDEVEIRLESAREALIKARFAGSNGSAGAKSSSGTLAVKAPMPGLVRAIRADVGDMVEKGATLIVLEAMKMENNILAPRAGKIASIKATLGNSVDKNSVLCEIESP